MALPLLDENPPPARCACQLHTLQARLLQFQPQEALASFKITYGLRLLHALTWQLLVLPRAYSYQLLVGIARHLKSQLQ